MSAVKLVDLLHAHFGIKTTYYLNPEVDEVGVAVIRIMPANPNRVGLILMNTSANVIYVSPRNDVAVGTGLILVPAGGAITLKWDVDFEFVASAFYAIAGGANSAITCIEIVSI